MPIPRPCKVCNAKAVSAHFGVDSCRACAAFFRRTVLLKRTYICRQSTDNCKISTDVKFTCRRCRWEKCLKVGMNPDSVPLASNLRVADEEWMKNQPSDPSPADSRKDDPEALPVKVPDWMNINSPRESVITKKGLLDIIAEQYSILEQISVKNDDCVMREVLGDRLVRRNGSIPATFGQQNLCILASHQPMIDCVIACFPEIGTFDENEKELVLRNFMTSRFIFDGVHRAQKAFPGNDRIFMVTFNCFVDIDHIEDYLSDIETSYDKAHSLRTMREMTAECTSDWLGPLLTKAAMDEVETAAIYGLLCWPSYMSGDGASTRVMEVCYKYHQQIFRELHKHYKQTGQTDYASRVAHISSILLCVQAAIQRLKEDMQIYRLLDVYSGNELEYKVVLGCPASVIVNQ